MVYLKHFSINYDKQKFKKNVRINETSQKNYYIFKYGN